MELSCPLPVIGVVRTGHHEKETTPIQAGVNRAEHAPLEVSERYRDGLDGLQGFDYAWLITWLNQPDRTGEPPLRQVPVLLSRQRRGGGIFATRGPRPGDPIGPGLVQ